MRRLLAASLLLFCGMASSADFSVIRKYSRPIFVTHTISERSTAIVGNGSGIVIAEGYMLTAAHVVDKKTPLKFFTGAADKAITITVVKSDPTIDIALVTSPDIKCPCASFATSVAQDEDAWAVGFPKLMAYRTQFLTSGLIQNYTNNSIVTTALAAPGSSGGGLFVRRDGKYVLAGIIKTIGTNPQGPEALGIEQEYHWMTFAVPANIIQQFLKGTPAGK